MLGPQANELPIVPKIRDPPNVIVRWILSGVKEETIKSV